MVHFILLVNAALSDQAAAESHLKLRAAQYRIVGVKTEDTRKRQAALSKSLAICCRGQLPGKQAGRYGAALIR
jgi:hypothetical protein